jgi:3-oxoacyl-[acyl-carrier protein] reductase
MKKLNGKVAIVTGASKGIGAAIAKAIAAEGASVVVNYSSSKQGADRVVAEIVAQDGKAVAVQGDVAKSADVKRLFEEALKYFDPKGGSVINISSVVSDNPFPGSAIYAATKGAIDTLTVGLSRELASRNIRVNAIAPGGVETEGAHTAGIIGSDFERQIVASTPLGRLGQPQDIAKVAVFLASEDSAWLTGERISASGGNR